MQVSVNNLEGHLLDWAVAQAINDPSLAYHKGRPAHEVEFDPEHYGHYSDMERYVSGRYFMPSSDWEQGGPLIYEYGCSLNKVAPGWEACIDTSEKLKDQLPLVAAMRAIVLVELGENIEIPGDVAEALGATS